MGRLKELHKK